jgi:hypothetical protein
MNAQTPPANPATAKKMDMVTIMLSVSYPAKDNMTIGDLTAEGQKALKLCEEAKKLGEVTGYVAIGNRKFTLK